MNKNTKMAKHILEVKNRKMKYRTIVLTVALLVLIPGIVYASHEPEPVPIEEQPCVFTSYIDRSVRTFTERIQVWGYVHPNCDSYELWDSYKVHIKVVNMEGEVVEDDWIPKARDSVDEEDRPTLYEFDAIIQEVGLRLAKDSMNETNHKVYPNMYYVEIPQLNSIHFELMRVYAVEASYGNMTVSHNFVIIE